MALLKSIELNNGIVLNYHRITSLNKITNMTTVIEVSSYVSEAQRQKEQAYQLLQKKNAENAESLTEQEKEELDKGIDVYIQTEYLNMPYDENTTIENAYAFLQTLDKYKNSENI